MAQTIKLKQLSQPSLLDEYSNILRAVKGGLVYEACNNVALISEASFARLVARVNDENLDGAIITAYRAGHTKRENIERNRTLRLALNDERMGVYQLVGHWNEDGIDVVERSYFVVRPEHLSFDEFKALLLRLMTIDGETQDAIILKHQAEWLLMLNNGETQVIGSKVSLGKISQAYSQSVLKLNTPFLIEGMEVPQSITSAAYLFQRNNILFIHPFWKKQKTKT